MRKPRKPKRVAPGRPDRLKINFRDLRASYELFPAGGCTRADLIVAGFSEEHADALVWNSYSKEPMEHTLIRPEEWFWTDRAWWSEDDAPHLQAMYDCSGGSFTDLSPREQASLLEVEFRALTGKKARGPLWCTSDGRHVDIVRFVHHRLEGEGWEMAPAYPETMDLLVRNRAKDVSGKDVNFIGEGDPKNLRQIALDAVAEIIKDPGAEWDRRPNYYLQILTGFRKILDFDKAALLEAARVIGDETYSAILRHYWSHRSYENGMSSTAFPPLIGRRDGKLHFMFATQKSSFRANVSRFVRDYARPLKLNVALFQVSEEPKR